MPCKTVGVDGKSCIFPFKYDSTTFNRCTTKDSGNGQPWCATKVDREDNYQVIDNEWGECVDGCPGTGYKGGSCYKSYICIMLRSCMWWKILQSDRRSLHWSIYSGLCSQWTRSTCSSLDESHRRFVPCSLLSEKWSWYTKWQLLLLWYRVNRFRSGWKWKIEGKLHGVKLLIFFFYYRFI